MTLVASAREPDVATTRTASDDGVLGAYPLPLKRWQTTPNTATPNATGTNAEEDATVCLFPDVTKPAVGTSALAVPKRPTPVPPLLAPSLSSSKFRLSAAPPSQPQQQLHLPDSSGTSQNASYAADALSFLLFESSVAAPADIVAPSSATVLKAPRVPAKPHVATPAVPVVHTVSWQRAVEVARMYKPSAAILTPATMPSAQRTVVMPPRAPPLPTTSQVQTPVVAPSDAVANPFTEQPTPALEDEPIAAAATGAGSLTTTPTADVAPTTGNTADDATSEMVASFKLVSSGGASLHDQQLVNSDADALASPMDGKGSS